MGGGRDMATSIKTVQFKSEIQAVIRFLLGWGGVGARNKVKGARILVILLKGLGRERTAEWENPPDRGT